MKKLVLLSIFTCTTLFAQVNKVDFHLNEDGELVRTDSDKNYYVFEYEPSIEAQELENSYYNKWEYIKKQPPYFEWPYIATSFDRKTGEISGRTPYYRGGVENVMFKYKYRIQFRDGRIRIDPPEILVNREYESDWYSIPQWINSSSLLFSKQIKTWKKEFVETVANTIINTLLWHVENVDKDEWSTPQELGDMETIHFTLDKNAHFAFAENASSAVYRIEGMTKQQLKESYNHFLAALSSGKDRVYTQVEYGSSYENGFCYYISGGQDLYLSGLGFLKSHCTISYMSYIQFDDNMVRVFVPRITRATIHYESSKDSEFSFMRFLNVFSIYNKDGSFNIKRQETIDEINKTFNILSFAPLYLIESFIKERDKPEEDW